MKSAPKTLRARNLHRQMTDAEKILWFNLKNRHFQSYKFRRQYLIGPYYIDFYCSQLRLGIEVDGGQHYTATGQQYDRIRELYIRSKDIRIIRYSNLDVIKNTRMVIDDLLLKIRVLNSSPYPLLKEERDDCGDIALLKEERDDCGDIALLKEERDDCGDIALLKEERDCCGDYSLLKEERDDCGDIVLLKEERDCCGSNSIYISSFETDKRSTKNTKNKEVS